MKRFILTASGVATVAAPAIADNTTIPTYANTSLITSAGTTMGAYALAAATVAIGIILVWALVKFVRRAPGR